MTTGSTIFAVSQVFWIYFLVRTTLAMRASKRIGRESGEILEAMTANASSLAVIPSPTIDDIESSRMDFDLLRIQHDEVLERWSQANDKAKRYVTRQFIAVGGMFTGLIINLFTI